MATNFRNKGLGRRPSTIKPPASVILRRLLGPSLAMPSRTFKYWPSSKFFLDQGSQPHCVGYAWLHLLLDSPVTYTDIIRKRQITPAQLREAAIKLYGAAQKVDEWPGEAYEGTSVRAGAEILLKEVATNFGATLVESVLWGTTLSSLIETVLFKGPVVMGSNWYESMFDANDKGNIHISGRVAGGHAYIINGVNTASRKFRIKNSWGKAWGRNGYGYIGFDDMERLVNEDGEVALVVERPRSKTKVS